MLKAGFLALISAAVCSAQAPSAAPPKGSVSGSVASSAGEALKNVKLTLQGLAPALKRDSGGANAATSILRFVRRARQLYVRGSEPR